MKSMTDKKDAAKFTIRFNPYDPQHKAVIDLLNRQGRSKAQFIASAVLHYISCKETPEIHVPIVPDEKMLEKIVLAIIEKKAKQEGKSVTVTSRPDGCTVDSKNERAPGVGELEQWFGGQNGMDTILGALQMFEQN